VGREGATSDAVILTLRVEVMPSWRRAVFTGYDVYDREELEMWAGLVGQPVDRGAVSTIIQRIEERYHEDGYAKVKIEADYRYDDDEVRFVITEGPKVTVSELEFIGNESIVGGNWWTLGLDIRESLNNKPGALFLSDSAYSEARLREDENGILKLYADYGFLEAQVSHEVEYIAEDEVKVSYFIEEGPLYRVRSVSIVSSSGEELRFPIEELQGEIGLKAGDPYELARIRSDVFALQKFYGARGYPSSARVKAERLRFQADYFRIQDPLTRRTGPVITIDEDEALVDVRFEVHEGLPKRVRDIVIRGNARTEDRVVRREVQTEPGDLAIEEDALRTYRRLIGLGYFRDRNRVPYVAWHWQDIGDQELVDLVFEVKDESTNNRLRFGGSFSSENGPAILIELQKQNFDLTDLPTSWGGALGQIWDGSAFTGAGQSLNLSLQPGSRYSTYSLAFTEPDLLREHIDRLSLTVFGRKTVRLLSTYEEERNNAGFRVGRRFGRYFTVFAGPEWGAVKVSDVDPLAPQDLIDQEGKNDLNTFTAGVRFNTVEDPFSPVDGGDLGLTLAQTGGFMGGTWDFIKGEVRMSNYLPLWQDSRGRHWVLATRGRASQAWVGDDMSSLPYTERFYIGGHSTVRGFQYRGIGEDANGFANGGDVSWTGSVEVRFPVLSSRQRGQLDEFEMIRGGLFLDMGSYGQEWDLLTPTRASVGFGIRMRFPAMPTAPLSLDFGWPIRSVDGDDERVFSFTFGNF
jgi:outer membrane protein insertion porin family